MPSPELADPLLQEVRAGDRTRYLAQLFAPETARPALTALAAYRLELLRIVTRLTEPLAAEVRLQWWRDAIRGEGTGAVSGVPLVDALRDGMDRYAWPADTLADVSEAHIHDLYADPFADLTAFDGYAGETEGALTQLSAMALAITAHGRRDGLAAARGCAAASGYAGVTLTAERAVLSAEDALERSRTLIPETVWRQAGVEIAGALSSGNASRQGVNEAIARIASHGLSAHAAMRELLPASAPAVRVAFLPAMAARPLLETAHRAPHKVVPPPQWRTQLRLWRSARWLAALRSFRTS